MTGQETEPRERWLRNFHPNPAAATELICFPHAGGAAGYWYGLSAAVGPGIAVSSVQYPGRQDRRHEAPVSDLHLLADRITEALAGGSDRPLAFFGHSMGASLAYEVAARLERTSGGGPSALFVSGRRAPSRRRAEARFLGDDRALIDKVKSLGGTGSDVLEDPEIVDMILPALRGDYGALAAYRDTSGVPLNCPVVALAGAEDTEASVEDVRAWRHHTTGSFRLHVFRGGHFFVTDHLSAVAELVAGLLPAPA
ncbi:thioesterase II family protein [Streptomyces iconiensis]|uniref:Alpha/beta fold hydrolase n=1 Tax=Streptomyces iconiensis TaxID=1384038 RepID=A0ABT7A7Z5_9ACTN|nr:alpha/beta fold hydrolase [Streptomyces iconiensis]MDJ1137465.1 alpha/beta fold hydrolase [Streptomyces iconiensis]